MAIRHFLFGILPLLLAFFASTARGDDSNFQISNYTGEIRKRADFWLQVYTVYSDDQGVIHDAQYPYIIFEKIDRRKKSTAYIETRKKHYANLLMRLSKYEQHRALAANHTPSNRPAQTTLDKELQELSKLYSEIGGENKFFEAANYKRVRFQRGQKTSFARGLRNSKSYLPQMEKIFKERGLPVELTRLPFVESSFNVKARSKVGASGIWQFMPSTGKLYLRIDSEIDERNDPIRATEAAAELLSANFKTLGDWSLAVTAYNHGRKALLRAMHKYKVYNLNDLLTIYRHRSFGFASSNFFPELLAAIEAEKNASKYFFDLDQEFHLDQK